MPRLFAALIAWPESILCRLAIDSSRLCYAALAIIYNMPREALNRILAMMGGWMGGWMLFRPPPMPEGHCLKIIHSYYTIKSLVLYN